MENQSWQDDSFYAVIVAASLEFYRMHLQDFPERLQSSLGRISYLCEEFRDRLCDYINSICYDGPKSSLIGQAVVAFDILASYPNLLPASDDMDARMSSSDHLLGSQSDRIRTVKANLKRLADKILEKIPNKEPGSTVNLGLDQALQAVRKAQRLLDPPDPPDPLKGYTIFERIGSPQGVSLVGTRMAVGTSFREQRHHFSGMLRSTRHLGPDEQANLLISLINQDLDHNTLLLLQALVMPQNGSTSQLSEEGYRALSKVLNGVCEALLRPQSFQVSVLSAHSINIILQKHVCPLPLFASNGVYRIAC